MRGPYVYFMLPDFSGLYKQSRDRTLQRSLKPSNHKGSDNQKTFQLFPKHSEQRPQGKINHDFFAIWTTFPSWSPILLTKDGWRTVLNDSGKKVPLTLGTIESCYRRGIVLGKRFGQLTNYLLIDVDISSPFHPRNGSIKPLLTAMEAIGLCRYLLLRSSTSGGVHLYFPLAEPVNTLGLACAAHAALTAAHIPIAGGTCELFPNKKAFNAEHNGHRLPLQHGSFILDDDFNPISDSQAHFLQHWQTAAAAQDSDRLAEVLTEKPLPMPTTFQALPPICWEAFGQSNEVMKQLVNYGDRYLGLNTIPALAEWIIDIAPQLPGFDQFASPESKDDLLRHNWAYRWAKSHFKSAYRFAALNSPNHNNHVAAAAKAKVFETIAQLGAISKTKVTQLWKLLSDQAKKLYGEGISWKVFTKYKAEILKAIDSSRNLGLSSGNKEDKNLIPSETANTNLSAQSPEPEEEPTELLTARCVTSSEDKDLNLFTPPSEQPNPAVPAGEQAGTRAADKLAVGQLVRIVMPSGSLDGIETRVLAKTVNVLGQPVYRLDYQRQGQAITLPAECLQVVQMDRQLPGETVLKATAQQLLQVLGKACPFFGAGLWTVRREEVPDKAWRQLCRLVGET